MHIGHIFENIDNVTFYHGSPIQKLAELKPIDDTGSKGHDGHRPNFRDVVFLTTDYDKAWNFAGKDGSVYVVSPVNPRRYLDVYKERDIVGKSNTIKKKKLKTLEQKSQDIYVADYAKILDEITWEDINNN